MLTRRTCRKALVALVSLVGFTLPACGSFSLRDAVAAGTYDFVSGSVTELLTAMSPLTWMNAQ